jgi:predicted dehydrogenase
MTVKPIDILVVGCGNMGSSHAKAYDTLGGFNIVGLVSRGSESRNRLANKLNNKPPTFDNYEQALAQTKPDAVSINTYASTHADYALKAIQKNAHVFVEKPLAETVEKAQAVVEAAKKANKKLLIGYILRHHPGWTQFVKYAKDLGKPLVMRMNLNQQSRGQQWQVHKNLMETTSPIVDCGVHYVDMMCQMTEAAPIAVHAIGARLTEEISPHMYNYGQLQLNFDDGSVGWYESGWGPMISESSYFIKDVMGPKGSISIRKDTFNAPPGKSADIEEHTKVNKLYLNELNLNKKGKDSGKSQIIETPEEPGHDKLCFSEQEYFLKAINEDIDLSSHMNAAVKTLQIVLACDESVKTGEKILL